MKNKISLLLFLVLITFAICSAAERSEKTEKTSLSEEASFSRVARSADADAGGKKNKSLKKKKRKHQKSKKGAKKAIKSEKNKRKAQKNKRKAKKNKRKTQKKKKNVNKRKRKAKKHKRNKKNQSNEKNQSIKKNKERTQEGKNWPLDGHCVECAASGMNRWRTVVANFAKQKSRIEKQSEIATKKGAKNGVFAPIALKLVAVGGGNKSNLTCSGSADSNGAKQLTNLTQTLFACEAKLNQSCAAVDVNMTHVNQCAMDLELFENRTKECLALSKSDTAIQACYCWINETYRALDNKIKSCKIAESTNVTKGLKACKDAFSTCRQAEDDAVDALAACSVSEETLLARAAALGANVNMTSACATQVAGITGSSGQVPRIRSARAAASNCSEFITLVDKLVTILLEYPASPEVLVVGGYIIASATPTCSDEEKTSLLESEASLTKAIVFLVEAYNEAQASLMEATGSTVSISDLAEYTVTATTPHITTMAARFRMRGFQSKVLRH